MLAGLIIVGATATIWGLVWGEVFPINKALWTSSYVLFVGGLATILLGVFYWLIDVKKIPQGIYLFFLVYGVNAMTVFFGSGLIPRLLGDIKIQGTDNKPIGSKQWLYENLIIPHFELKINASLAAALTFALIWFVVLYILWRKKIIVKV
jgi:predicted acyltransferase